MQEAEKTRTCGPDGSGWVRAHRVLTVSLSSLLGLLLVTAYLLADVTDALPGPLTLQPMVEKHYPAPATVGAVKRPLTGPADRNRPIDQSQAQQLVDQFAATDGLGEDWSLAIGDAQGHLLVEHEAQQLRQPASTMKTLTALAAASGLDMGSTLDTQTYLVQAPEGDPQLTLTGHGDMLLGRGDNDPKHVNGRAGLRSLAFDTAQALGRRGISQVRLAYDDSLFADQRSPAGIDQNDPDHMFFTPPSSMAVDGGRLWPEGGPDDPDGLNGYPPLSTHTASDAAQTFADLLAQEGISVLGAVEQGTTPAASSPLASVSSAPLSQVMAFMLRHSDNTLAEEFGRLLALAVRGENTPAGAVAAVKAKLADLRIDSQGLSMADCSGLAPQSLVSAKTLVEVQVQNLRPGAGVAAAEGLSVPGLVGTAVGRLDDGQLSGQLRVKTGTLDDVTSMSGNISRSKGGLLAFAVIVNKPQDAGAAKEAIDRFITQAAGL
ncbi:D-alanyl-D-alanine carboxypeptidase/D-alanyl-D-alanine-endopeptidase [Bifidobacterium aemilianum]|uniref:D-alanyl-D-alanine carboxypeptidase/D-alanyl-D-alanine-endopeptidase n=1 Tax=Bifidobacterium aemilianum TaxID=2493120 RepID=A0A366K9P7_9BIFI|nr:D-alanyl-D-alanine carboxypeptidase/D-alanyl-D-alanine-endopeptidase [Bifidobacterium aemilianum]RBP97381.1 D-alanyl-D-alanine carboxypeptidase/D-alanyl-D-alanine-endopeptidase [Bifidobacterium aemilianum]